MILFLYVKQGVKLKGRYKNAFILIWPPCKDIVLSTLLNTFKVDCSACPISVTYTESSLPWPWSHLATAKPSPQVTGVAGCSVVNWSFVQSLHHSEKKYNAFQCSVLNCSVMQCYAMQCNVEHYNTLNCSAVYPNDPRILTPPWQLSNAVMAKQAGLVLTFFNRTIV